MKRLSHPRVLALALVLAVPAAACSDGQRSSASARGGGAPAAPAMPPEWVVQSDVDLPIDALPALEAQLGGKVKAVRNTIYALGSVRVQLNTIAPVDAAAADAIYRTLSMSKPAYALARKGDVIYEFVGPDVATEAIKKAQASLMGG